MEEKKTLYLHIGQHKTGTSSIQAFLAKNRKALARQGFCYPKSLSDKYAHHALAFAIINKKHYLSNKNFYDRSVKYILAQLKANKYRAAILSSEVFWGTDPEQVRTYFANFNVQVIVYLRRIDEFIVSAYSERLKSTTGRLEVSSFAEVFAVESKRWRKRYQVIRQWVKVFGVRNVHLRPFEKEQFYGNDLLLDFINCISLSPVSMQFNYRLSKENTRLDMTVSRVLLVLNRIKMPGLDLQRLKLLVVAWARKQKLFGESVWMTQEQQAEILGLVEETETKLARQLLGQDQLFLTPPKSLSPPVSEDSVETMVTAMKIIFAVQKQYRWRLCLPAEWYFRIHRCVLQLMQRVR